MFLLITISTLTIASVRAVSESNFSETENVTVSNQAQEMLTCYSCSNFLVENETTVETCWERENFCFGTHCFVVREEFGNFFSGCVNVAENVKIVEFTDDFNSVCRWNGSYSECICIFDKCNGFMLSNMASYADGNILSTLMFDLVKKAVLVTAAQLADIDQQEEVEGVRSVDVDTDASAIYISLENMTTAMSSTTHSNTTNISVSATISTTTVVVTKQSESMFSRDYGLLIVFVMILLAQTVLAVNGP